MRPFVRSILLILAVLVLSSACSSSKKSDSNDTNPTGGRDAGSGDDAAGAHHRDASQEGGTSTSLDAAGTDAPSLGTPPLVVEPDATMMAISLALVSDSSGTTPASGAYVTLMFEPPSTAHLLAIDASTLDVLSYNGTYSLTGSNLTMTFKVSGFERSGTMAFDATQPKVTLPFQVFSTSAGTSSWDVNVAFIAQNAQDLFLAYTSEQPSMSLTDRTAAVLAYAKHYVAVHADIQTQALATGAQAPHTLITYPWYLDPAIANVALNSDGTELIFYYADGTQGAAILCERVPQGTGTLTMSPLASDKRLALAITPVNGNDDPQNHTALFVAPFDSARYYGYYPGGTNAKGLYGLSYGFGQYDNLAGMQKTLSGAGIDVTQLTNADVTIDALINALSGTAPGFVYFSTHGAEDGEILTGQELALGTPGGNVVARKALAEIYDHLEGEGYEDLINAKGIGFFCIPRALGLAPKDGTACYASLTPAFFTWLKQKKGTDFSSSLVLTSACRTDETDALRNAIAAKAYFAYNVSVFSDFSGAVGQYFAESLVRHTHTAEETYYNIIRVTNSRQIVYPEDALFQGIGAIADTGGYEAFNMFHGYFAQSGGPGSVIDYRDTGWLAAPSMDLGTIWYLLYAGRWGGSASQGAMNFSTCWTTAWSMGTMGDSGTWCNDATPGYTPDGTSVAYANYLLTGSTSGMSLPAVGNTVARWTLNDSKP
jgi:hypothetical protein